jgi:hypothetical protein
MQSRRLAADSSASSAARGGCGGCEAEVSAAGDDEDEVDGAGETEGRHAVVAVGNKSSDRTRENVRTGARRFPFEVPRRTRCRARPRRSKGRATGSARRDDIPPV